jgi:hypothetical protein
LKKLARQNRAQFHQRSRGGAEKIPISVKVAA